MPTPSNNETQDEFISRCIPVVIQEGTARNTAQAYAICRSYWDNKIDDEFTLQRINTEEASN